MLNLNSQKIFIACILLLLSITVSCSKPSAHVGGSITHTEIEPGVALTEADSRHLLPSGKLAGQESALAVVESTVHKIDYKTRMLTLKTAQGEPIELIAGPEIKNFAQIQAGDKVSAEYFVSIAFEVREPTAQELAAASGSAVEASARAKLGEMPAGGEAKGKISVTKIQSINKASGTIELRNITTGNVAQVKAKYPENLSYVKEGDSVVITAVEAVAASVARIP